MYTSDKEAIILELIYYDDSLKQRELADKVGISLGMTNAILKRLIEKGWLMTKRLNSRNISYVVSPAGLEAVFRRGYQYFERTMDDVRQYKEEIGKLVYEVVKEGYKTITLVGQSNLDFIVEYACEKTGILFNKVETDKNISKDTFVLYSELYEVMREIAGEYYLRKIVFKENNK